VKLATNNSWLEWLLLATLALSAECGSCQTAVLLRAADVSRDTIKLSDLLPPEASPGMRRAAEQIELGRTPQCHTIRFFEAADIARQTSSWPALQGLTLLSRVPVQRTCFPIRREQVQRAISEFTQGKESGIVMMGAPFSLSESILASRENPTLEVEQALPDPARPGLQIRLRCMERTVCPSFWVTVPARQRPHFLSTAATAHGNEKGAPLVESGQRVMLTFEDPPMRIQLPVTCLQRGWLGKQVRAMDPSTHRVFRAEVTGAGTLTARL
jgi:hypothetical protein